MSIIHSVARKRTEHIARVGAEPTKVVIPQPLVRGLLSEVNCRLSMANTGESMDKILMEKSDSELVDYINDARFYLYGIPVKATHDQDANVRIEY